MSLKNEVREYWQNHICGTREHLTRNPVNLQPISDKEEYSKEYFQELEDYRYSVNPEVFEFAQFTRYKDKTILEIGIGAGFDFLQWCRVSTFCYGVDLTPASIEHTTRLINNYGFSADLSEEDAEDLPFSDNYFDLVYSWGVLHHTPNTIQAISEAIRVCKVGGSIKLMLYNRHSTTILLVWFYTMLKTKKIKSPTWCLAHGIESEGTKAYTFKELRHIFSKLPVKVTSMEAKVNNYDLLHRYPKILRLIPYILCSIVGFNKAGFFITINLKKVQ